MGRLSSPRPGPSQLDIPPALPRPPDIADSPCAIASSAGGSSTSCLVLRRSLAPKASAQVSLSCNPPEPLADMRRADARSAQICGPDFISQCFQVRSNSGEPYAAILARNLLSNDFWRLELRDESPEI